MRVPAKFVCEGCGDDAPQTGAEGWCIVGVSGVGKNGEETVWHEQAHLCKACAAPFKKGLWFIDPEREAKR